MIRRTVKKKHMGDYSEIEQNLEYWLGRPGAERVAAVDFLRRQVHGNAGQLQRVVRVVRMSEAFNEEAEGNG